MKRVHVAVVGLGRLGRAVASQAREDDQILLTGAVRRPEQVGAAKPAALAGAPVVSHIGELPATEVALVCVPTEVTRQVVQELLQHGVGVVECASLHGEPWQEHKQAIDRLAHRNRARAVVGAGWDPGALSVFREWFALLAPLGHTEVTRRPGISLHHTTVAGAVSGVRAALATELRTPAGDEQRYVYVELERGADEAAVRQAIANDPLFVGTETLVFAVPNLTELEEEGRGILLQRRARAGGADHPLLLLEARYSEPVLSARVMLAAARALPACRPGAWSLTELPLGALWGGLHDSAERDWM